MKFGRSHTTIYLRSCLDLSSNYMRIVKHSPLQKGLQETKSLQFLHICERHLKVFLTEQHLQRMEGLAVTNTKDLQRCCKQQVLLYEVPGSLD